MSFNSVLNDSVQSRLGCAAAIAYSNATDRICLLTFIGYSYFIIVVDLNVFINTRLNRDFDGNG